MIEFHPSLDSLSDDVVLWRYMSLSKFIDLVKKEALYFCRIDKFDDKFEGKITLLDMEMFCFTSKDLLYWERKLKSNFANCWIMYPTEQNLMWQNYGKEGVAIKTTVGRLIRSQSDDIEHNIYLSPVRYNNESSHNPGERLNIYHILFNKRVFFLQENEVRLLLPRKNVDETIEGIPIKVNLKELIEEVVVSPFANKFLKKVENELKVKGIQNVVRMSEI